MSEPFISEIRIFGFNFPPRGWAQCDGQILPINQNQTLYSLLGTTYGGNGRTDFGLPDLRGRSPMHFGEGDGLSNRPLGQKSGSETETLTVGQIAAHSHQPRGSTTTGTENGAAGDLFAPSAAGYESYATSGSAVMGPTTSTGGGGAHNNVAPVQALNFCIALQGLFPSRS